MLKITTFKIGDEKINDFIDTVGILPDGIKVSGDNIVILHRDTKYPTFTKEAELQDLHQELYKEEATLSKINREIEYAESKEDDETKESVLETLEKKKNQTLLMIDIIKKKIG